MTAPKLDWHKIWYEIGKANSTFKYPFPTGFFMLREDFLLKVQELVEKELENGTRD